MLRVAEVMEHLEAQMLSQYFTKQKVVEKILEIVDLEDYDLIIEPSAGDGAFSKYLPKEKTAAVDLEPKAKGIKEKDFLEFSDSISMVLPLIAEDKKILTIGNPPFGKNSSPSCRL